MKNLVFFFTILVLNPIIASASPQSVIDTGEVNVRTVLQLPDFVTNPQVCLEVNFDIFETDWTIASSGYRYGSSGSRSYCSKLTRVSPGSTTWSALINTTIYAASENLFDDSKLFFSNYRISLSYTVEGSNYSVTSDLANHWADRRDMIGTVNATFDHSQLLIK
jgi:hypothetical protein